MSFRKGRIHILDAARAQISQILLYSERHWGEEQRDLYLERLMATVEALANAPDIVDSFRLRTNGRLGISSPLTGTP